MEEVIYTPEGKLVTDGPTNYKIPSVCDIPQQMNISLLSGSYQPIRTVYSSKVCLYRSVSANKNSLFKDLSSHVTYQLLRAFYFCKTFLLISYI